jgi:hypothetical protein
MFSENLYWEHNDCLLEYNVVRSMGKKEVINIETLKPLIINNIDSDRVSNADMSYPILVLVDGDVVLYILDGNHRVAKALQYKLLTIDGYVVDINSDVRLQKIFK